MYKGQSEDRFGPLMSYESRGVGGFHPASGVPRGRLFARRPAQKRRIFSTGSADFSLLPAHALSPHSPLLRATTFQPTLTFHPVRATLLRAATRARFALSTWLHGIAPPFGCSSLPYSGTRVSGDFSESIRGEDVPPAQQGASWVAKRDLPGPGYFHIPK
mgnify:CR=1 FL=1